MAFKYTTRADGRLMKRVSINGKMQCIYSTDPKDLERQYIDLKYKSNNNLATDTTNITFEQYAEKWFKLNISNKEEATQKTVRNRLNHIYKFIGKIKLVNLKPFHIQEIVTTMHQEGLKDITNRTLGDCKRILEDAVINDVISKNVAKGIKKIKYAKDERIPLSIDEDKRVYQCALNHKYGSFILLLRYCGLRPEEAVALTINDIDFKNKLLIVNKAVSLSNNQPSVKATKNLKNRKIPIPDFLLDILKNNVSDCNEIGSKYIFSKEKDKTSMLTKQALRCHLQTFLNDLNKDNKNFNYLKKDLRKLKRENKTDIEIYTKRIKALSPSFKTNQKIKLNIDYLQELITDYEEKKLIKFTYYQLRHSYCTMLYYSGIKIKKAQELMGHSSAKMVYDIYAHLDEERENASECINNYINNTIISDTLLTHYTI